MIQVMICRARSELTSLDCSTVPHFHGHAVSFGGRKGGGAQGETFALPTLSLVCPPLEFGLPPWIF